ncbi:hypothetical protein ASE27_09590 [Oerskovia sp. Root918]|nr:hypothetical protein ASE27_09590 [Oerskovia sp. Root918]
MQVGAVVQDVLDRTRADPVEEGAVVVGLDTQCDQGVEQRQGIEVVEDPLADLLRVLDAAVCLEPSSASASVEEGPLAIAERDPVRGMRVEGRSG